MAEYSNVENRPYSGLEHAHGLEAAQNEYSTLDHDSDHEGTAPRRDSDNGSLSGRSDHGSTGYQNHRAGHHDDDHSVHDREGDRSDREDDRQNREDARSDREDARSDREDARSDREDGRSDRVDVESESHSVPDREGSLRNGDDGLRGRVDSPRDRDDGPRDQAGDLYDNVEGSNVYDELVAQAEAQEEYYNNVERDRRSDDGHSDKEDGHEGTVKRETVEVARATVYEDVIYDELEHQSDSEGSEKGEHARGHGPVSDDPDDDLDARDGHTHEHGHERRGSHESDEVEKHKSPVEEGIKRQTSSTSGKFVLRTSRKADALHVVRSVRDSSCIDDNPETDELVTILRSTHDESVDEESSEEAKQREKLKSFITSKLIHKFEQGIASEEAFNEFHDDNGIAESSKVSESHNTTVVKTTVSKTTVGKTTVVKTTVKAEVTSPVSPKSPNFPGSDAALDISRSFSSSSSSSSLSSASQMHHKTVTYSSQLSNSGTNSSRHPANELPKTPEDGATPAWKAEIEIRKKTKSHVPIQKPKEPMKMSEVPEWKKQLQEKNKMKKLSSSDEPDITLAKVTTLILNASAASLPLKVEMGRIKHENAINHGGHGDTMPEWARLADEKKKPITH